MTSTTREPAPTADPIARLDRLLDSQDLDPASRTFGQTALRPGGSVGDLNAVLFKLPELLAAHAQRPSLPASLTRRLDAALDAAAVAVERRWDEEVFDPHRDGLGYTNVTLLYVRALALLARHRGDGRLARKSTAQWRRWLHHVDQWGVGEFVSPTYGGIVLDTLAELRVLLPTDCHAGLAAAGRLVDATLSAATHPVLQLPVCGMSRSYRRCFAPGATPAWAGPLLRARAALGIESPPSPRRLPMEMSGRATSQPFRFRSWQARDAGVGSFTGGHYFWQQVALVAAVGAGPDRRAAAWLPSHPAAVAAFVDQRDGRALCLFDRGPLPLHRTQWAVPDHRILATSDSIGVGLTPGWEATTRDGVLHLSAYGRRLVVRPFQLESDRAASADLLQREPRPSPHRLPDNAPHISSWWLPDGARHVGCVVELLERDQPATPHLPTFTRNGAEYALREGDLSLQWTQLPHGVTVQRFADDFRLTPLLRCPTATIWPGELTAALLGSIDAST